MAQALGKKKKNPGDTAKMNVLHTPTGCTQGSQHELHTIWAAPQR